MGKYNFLCVLINATIQCRWSISFGNILNWFNWLFVDFNLLRKIIFNIKLLLIIIQ